MDERSRHLKELVECFDLEGLLAVSSPAEIAEAWCRHWELREAGQNVSSDSDPNWWAIELLFDNDMYRYRDGQLIGEIVLALVERADEDTVGLIGAGPLENFVSDEPSDVLWLEQQCERNHKLRRALSGSWYRGQVSSATALRLGRAASSVTGESSGQ